MPKNFPGSAEHLAEAFLLLFSSPPLQQERVADNAAVESKEGKLGSSNGSTLGQWSGRFLGIITGWDPRVCKPNRLHVDILQFSFIN